jgi:hypothetical protein
MSRVFWKLLLVTPATLFSSGLLTPDRSFAADLVAEPTKLLAVAPAASHSPVAEVAAASALSQEQLTVQTPAVPAIAEQAVATPAGSPLLAQSMEPVDTSVAELSGSSVSGGSVTPAAPTENDAGAAIDQVTSVSQLSDAKPTDWAYQALQSLVEKYGCIVGYPDSTFRGNRAATRFEMAAALNACLDVISDRFATKEDLAMLRKLMEEFAAELATIRGRVDNLEARTAKLEATQFSTTTKLRADVIFSFADTFGDSAIGGPLASGLRSDRDNTQTTFSSRVRLNLDTSFTGKDLLRTRIQAANVPNFASVTGTNQSRLGYDTNTSNTFQIAKLFYKFPIGDKLTIQVDALGGEWNDNVLTFNPLLASAERGALSRFGRFNPIYRNTGDTGATVTYEFTKTKNTRYAISVGYMAGVGTGASCTAGNTFSAGCFSAGNPTDPGGFINGPYAAYAQLEFQPISNLQFGLSYAHSFGLDPTGGLGSSIGVNPLGGTGDNRRSNVRNTAADNLGFQFSYKVVPKLTISGWVGYSHVYGVQGGVDGEGADVLNYAVSFASPDLFRKGDLAALIFGMPPKVISKTNGLDDPDTTYHLEALYRFQITSNIAVTPGVIALFSPNHFDGNDTILIGVIRTHFSF